MDVHADTRHCRRVGLVLVAAAPAKSRALGHHILPHACTRSHLITWPLEALQPPCINQTQTPDFIYIASQLPTTTCTRTHGSSRFRADVRAPNATGGCSCAYHRDRLLCRWQCCIYADTMWRRRRCRCRCIPIYVCTRDVVAALSARSQKIECIMCGITVIFHALDCVRKHAVEKNESCSYLEQKNM